MQRKVQWAKRWLVEDGPFAERLVAFAALESVFNASRRERLHFLSGLWHWKAVVIRWIECRGRIWESVSSATRGASGAWTSRIYYCRTHKIAPAGERRAQQLLRRELPVRPQLLLVAEQRGALDLCFPFRSRPLRRRPAASWPSSRSRSAACCRGCRLPTTWSAGTRASTWSLRGPSTRECADTAVSTVVSEGMPWATGVGGGCARRVCGDIYA